MILMVEKGDKFYIVNIKWDQKKGGIFDCASPGKDFIIYTSQSMNIYQAHRMRFQYGNGYPNFASMKLKIKEDYYSICSFFSGFGTTHPDGFTGDYVAEGQNVIGVPERVICIFLPSTLDANSYIMILGKIASRLLMYPEMMETNTEKIGNLILESGYVEEYELLFDYLSDSIDSELNLSNIEISKANENEFRILRYLIKEQTDALNNSGDVKLLKEIHNLKKENKVLENRITLSNAKLIGKSNLTQQQSINTSSGNGFSDIDAMVNAMNNPTSQNTSPVSAPATDDKYAMITSLSTENMTLKLELNGYKESMAGLVNDLKSALTDKINIIDVKDKKIVDLELELDMAKNI